MINIAVVKQTGAETKELFQVYAGGSHKEKMIFISGNATIHVDEIGQVIVTVTEEKSVLHN